MAAVTASAFPGLWVGRSSSPRLSRRQFPPASRTKASSELGFASSQLSGMRISFDYSVLAKTISTPAYRPFQPVARPCLIGLTDDSKEFNPKMSNSIGLIVRDIPITNPYVYPCFEELDAYVIPHLVFVRSHGVCNQITRFQFLG